MRRSFISTKKTHYAARERHKIVMKKILIVTSTFPQGSEDIVTARFVYELAGALTKYYKVHVLAPQFNNSKRDESVNGVNIHRFRYFFPSSFQLLSSGHGMLNDIKKNFLALFQLPAFFFSELINVINIIRREKIDIVNAHWAIPQGLICSLAKKITGVSLVVTVHAADVFLLKRAGFFGRTIMRFILKNSGAILPVSNYIKDQVISLSSLPKPYKVISMGTDIDKFNAKIDKKAARARLNLNDKFTFLFVGKLVEKKGLEHLMRALKILKDKNRDFKLLIAGGGPLEGQLKVLMRDLGLVGEVRFMGWVNNDLLPDIYSSSDVFIAPSIFDKRGETEGLPVVIIEAMACGVPVIASRVSGIPEIVSDNINGFLCSPGDPVDLAKKMDEILSCKDIGRLRDGAIQTSRNYSWQSISEKYKLAIEEL